MPSIEKKWIGALIFAALFVPGVFGQTAQMTGMVRSERHICSGRDGCDTERGDGIYDRDVTNDQRLLHTRQPQSRNLRRFCRRQGFRTITQTGIKLDVAQVARMDLT